MTNCGYASESRPAVQADMLRAEELSGDNQYHCDFCGKKVDATRQLCLRQLPPFLCLSLQRFVFDMKVQMHHYLRLVASMKQSLFDSNVPCALWPNSRQL